MTPARPSELHPLTPGAGLAPGGAFLARLDRRDVLWALGTGAIALSVYLATVAPTVTAEDSGEFCAAAWTLGVAHPPGYPLYLLLAKGFLTVLPVGEVAWRLNVLSGLLGAVSTALLVLLARRLGATRAASSAAGLLAAFAPSVWSQAVITEVYTLAAVCLLLVLHAFVSYLADPRASRLVLLSWAFGLSLTAHPILVLSGPGLALGVLLRAGREALRPGVLLRSLAFFALGLSVYAYLPIRSLADPVVDWGNPETPGAFLAHVLLRQYGAAEDAVPGGALDSVRYLAHALAFDVGAALMLLGALGARRLLRFPGDGYWPVDRLRARKAFRGFWVPSIVLSSVGLLSILGVSFDRHLLHLNRVFFGPLAFLLAPAAAHGLDRLAGAARDRLPALSGWIERRRLGWAAAAILPLGVLVFRWGAEDRSGYRLAREYAECVLRTLPEGAIYLPGGDHADFPVLYLQVVEGLRPDVVIADKYGYLDPAVLRRICRDEREVESLLAMPRPEAERWLIDRSGRPVFVNSKRAILEIPTERFFPVGLLYRVDRERRKLEPEEEDRLWASYRFSNLGEGFAWKGGARDAPGDFLLFEVLFHQAERLFERGKADEAVRTVKRLAEEVRGHRVLLHNLGVLLTERERLEDSCELFARALALDPSYKLARQSLARALLRSGSDPARAVEIAERSIEELPADPSLLKALAKEYRRLGRFARARDALEHVARVSPGDHEPSRWIGEMLEAQSKSKEVARPYYEEALRRKPSQPDLIEKLHGKEARERFEAEAKRIVDSMVEKQVPLVAGSGRSWAGEE